MVKVKRAGKSCHSANFLDLLKKKKRIKFNIYEIAKYLTELCKSFWTEFPSHLHTAVRADACRGGVELQLSGTILCFSIDSVCFNTRWSRGAILSQLMQRKETSASKPRGQFHARVSPVFRVPIQFKYNNISFIWRLIMILYPMYIKEYNKYK